MQATIFVSEDGYWMSEAQAREVAPGGELPNEVRVLRKLKASFIAEGEPPRAQEAFRVFKPTVIEVLHRDYDDEDVNVEMGRRMKRWTGHAQ